MQKYANLVELEKCCQTHIFLQNFVLIQPRTSPPKICKIFEKCIFEKCIFRKFCKFLAGSFSAVSKRNFARKYAFDSIFQALQDLHSFAPLKLQNFHFFCPTFLNFLLQIAQILQIFIVSRIDFDEKLSEFHRNFAPLYPVHRLSENSEILTDLGYRGAKNQQFLFREIRDFRVWGVPG